MKSWLTVAVAVVGLEINGVWIGMTVKVSVWFPMPPALLAERIMVSVPDFVGVPEMMPVEVFMLRPTGKPVALNRVGALLAWMV